MQDQIARLRFLVVVALAAMLLVIGSATARRAVAQLQGMSTSCGAPGKAAIATGATSECDYFTTAAISAGPMPAGLVLMLTGPSGTTFAAVNPVVAMSLTGALSGCTAIVSLGGMTLTITGCNASVAAGTRLETQLTIGGSPGAIQMTAAYNSSMPSAPFSFAYQFDTVQTPASVTTVTGQASPNASTCTNTTPGRAGLPLLVGNTFSCVIGFPPNQTPSFIVVAPAGSGNGGISPTGVAGFTLSNSMAVSGRGAATGYYCGAGPANSPCTSISVTGTITGAGTLAFQITAFALGATAPYVTGSFGTRGAPNPPLVGTNVCGSAGTAPVAVGATFECDITTTVPINALDPASLVLTAPVGATILAAFLTPPGMGVACFSSAASGTFTFGSCASTIPVGSVVQIYLSGTGVNPAINIAAQYNTITGPVAATYAEAYQFDAFANPAKVSATTSETDSVSSIDCRNTTTFDLQLLVGDSFTCTVITGASGNTPSFITLSPGSPGAATFVLTDPAVATGRPGVANGYACPPPPLTPASSCTLRVSALATGVGPLSFQLTAYALGAAVAYATIAVSTDSGSANRFIGPRYVLSLTPVPTAISAAVTGQGSTITAALAQLALPPCPVIQTNPPTSSCPLLTGGVPTLLTSPGAESGVLTFSTTAGVFSFPGAAVAGVQQVMSVHCGPDPASTPGFLLPVIGAAALLNFAACTSVTATLVGAGAAGTAIVTAAYVADFTGSTTVAAVTVTLGTTSPPVSLTKGCNQVLTGPLVPQNATATQILALVSPSSVVSSIWQFTNSVHSFQAFYFNSRGAPVDITGVGPSQSLFICVTATATFQAS